MIGLKFGEWTVLSFERKDHQYQLLWICQCSCGIKKSIRQSTLTCGKSRSCRACSSLTHGHTIRTKVSRTYNTWHAMTARCLNPTNGGWNEYGGRGIKVCERWLKFENFLSDMGERPEGKTLDRYPDNNGNYEIGNCRWATPKEQNQNRRTTKKAWEPAVRIDELVAFV